MLIRTQDKRSLVDMTGLTITVNQYVRYEDTPKQFFIYNVECSQSQYALGRYSTYEKAIKVLDMIQKEYEAANVNRGYPGGYVANTVFNMPSDEEVVI